mmetsp:Transcript_1291/g.1176  ORF Transcript_1291/g.1176 Transcript_1291/m.1176 type:complete len:173 (+) Transcript_1291:971-1489(+)
MIKKGLFVEDIVSSTDSPEKKIDNCQREHYKGMFGGIREHIEFYYFTKLQKYYFFAMGVICVGCSGLVFLSEILTFTNYRVIDYTLLVDSSGGFTKSQIFCMIPLLYIAFCVFTALFNIKVFNLFGLYPNHHTDTASLVFSAQNFSRIASPLVFNFFQMFDVSGAAFNSVTI